MAKHPTPAAQARAESNAVQDPAQPTDGQTWFAISTLHHDGVVYAPGDAVPLTQEQGLALLALGVISRVSPMAEPDSVEPADLA